MNSPGVKSNPDGTYQTQDPEAFSGHLFGSKRHESVEEEYFCHLWRPRWSQVFHLWTFRWKLKRQTSEEAASDRSSLEKELYWRNTGGVA